MQLLAPIQGLRLGHTLVLTMAWMLGIRAAFLLQSGVWPETPRLLISDVAGALVLTGLLMIARTPLLRVILILAIGSLLMVAGMHLSAHATFPRLSMFSKGADPVFLSSSVFNLHLLMLPVYIGLTWLLVRTYRWLVPTPPHHNVIALGIILGTVAVYLIASHSLTTARNNFLVSFIGQVPGIVAAPAGRLIGVQVAEDAQLESDSNYFHAKLASPEVERPPNVLLIMVEGLSAGYFPSISEYHELTPGIVLPELEKKLETSGFRLYRNTLSMERQTDRGTFAILCGQYPDFQRLSTKVADVAAEQALPLCMPEVLRNAGYYTAYWQAAPLEYMSKDRFMPRVGFIDATGADAFGSGNNEPTGWGPSDPRYFENVGQRLQALDKNEAPWLVTLLNVGTHHPFDVGDSDNDLTDDIDDPLPTAPQKDRRMAMKVMAQTLVGFLEELEQTGVLDNTLVILTSDESGGFVRQDQESFPLNGNTGVLAVRPPVPADLEHYVDRDRIVAQLDIPATILDVTGAGLTNVEMTGRSLLATEDTTSRELMLADTYIGMKYFLRESGEMLACTESLIQCQTWEFEPGRLFGTLTPTEKSPFLTLEQRLSLFNQAAELPPGPAANGK